MALISLDDLAAARALYAAPCCADQFQVIRGPITLRGGIGLTLRGTSLDSSGALLRRHRLTGRWTLIGPSHACTRSAASAMQQLVRKKSIVDTELCMMQVPPALMSAAMSAPRIVGNSVPDTTSGLMFQSAPQTNGICRAARCLPIVSIIAMFLADNSSPTQKYAETKMMGGHSGASNCASMYLPLGSLHGPIDGKPSPNASRTAMATPAEAQPVSAPLTQSHIISFQPCDIAQETARWAASPSNLISCTNTTCALVAFKSS